ncbi:hypothetical protein [Bacillus sp. COPE52]|uniref:hypothetical protein n=1 Tax=Bacillus sp. COPE52 TaxID=2233998 RepID=UPI000E107A57|nr:hypothetical protein [Bacillus sp. COPE52]AXK19137.1 hypothetical protein DPQ31_16130 [Bacillus sp. COPE52]
MKKANAASSESNVVTLTALYRVDVADNNRMAFVKASTEETDITEYMNENPIVGVGVMYQTLSKDVELG